MKPRRILIINDDPTASELQIRIVSAETPPTAQVDVMRVADGATALVNVCRGVDLIIADPGALDADRQLSRAARQWPGADLIVCHSLPAALVDPYLAVAAGAGFASMKSVFWAEGGLRRAVRAWWSDATAEHGRVVHTGRN